MIDGDLPPRPWTTGNDNNGHVTVFDASGEVVFLSIRKSLALPLMGMVNASGTAGEGVTHRCARCGIKWDAPLGPFSWACPVCDRSALEARDRDVERAATHRDLALAELAAAEVILERRKYMPDIAQARAHVRGAQAKLRGADSGQPNDFRDSSSKDLEHPWPPRAPKGEPCAACGCVGCIEWQADCPIHGIDAVDPALATDWVRDPCATCGRFGKWHPPAP